MEERPPKRKKKGRRKGKEFMDAAREAFVRHLALEKFREVEDMKETLGFDDAKAAQEACTFLERGPYREIWRRHWREVVLPAASGSPGAALLGAMEEAIASALLDEEAARGERGDRPLDEDPEYKAFVDASMERLFREQAGELEQLD